MSGSIRQVEHVTTCVVCELQRDFSIPYYLGLKLLFFGLTAQIISRSSNMVVSSRTLVLEHPLDCFLGYTVGTLVDLKTNLQA